MLDQSLRRAILELHGRGIGIRQIARLLKVSRNSIRTVLRQNASEVPRMTRTEMASAHHDEIVELYATCKGNLVRVHEMLVEQNVELSYPALTGYCRRHDIGAGPKLPAGRYHFEPGAEMQHDTSPHRVKIDGTTVRVQTASLVLCYSRLLFFQMYPRFDRFICKIFLTDALRYVGAACKTCMIDNTHVIVLHGTGAEMVPVPEMAAFAERYSFAFEAHEKGDANRSARVERPFHYIENNFIPGRKFADLNDLNQQARVWCDEKNATFRKRLHASPRELFAAERPALEPLPAWVPDVYRLHHRIVDIEGFVSLHSHRYSVPYEYLGRQVEVRETRDAVLIYVGPREVASHAKVLDTKPQRVTVPTHRPLRGQSNKSGPAPEETKILTAQPELAAYVKELKRRATGRGTLVLRRLWQMLCEYPRDALLAAVGTAQHYGMYDLDRLERMVLRNIGNDFFTFDGGGDDGDDT